MTDWQRAIEACHLGVFALPSQTSEGDKRSLLELQNLIARHRPGYVYLEVGSHLGGSLLPHLLDARCSATVSIDPRPIALPDERGRGFEYTDNSTARMIELLNGIAGFAPLRKLRTYDLDARDAMATGEIPPFDLAFVDGEHTNVAAASDFLAIVRGAQPDSIIAFHDADLVYPALIILERVLDHIGIPFTSVFLKDSVFAIGMGALAQQFSTLRPFATDRDAFLQNAEHALHKMIFMREQKLRRREFRHRILSWLSLARDQQ